MLLSSGVVWRHRTLDDFRAECPDGDRGLQSRIVEEQQAEAEDLGVEIADFVDAPNTLALFVWGPDRVKLEYIEHKPSFSLT